MAAPFHRARLVGARPGVRLDRTLSKLGFCSRAEAGRLIAAGRVKVNGVVASDPGSAADPARDRIEVDARPVAAAAPCYVMLNKPRGLVTTESDERGRSTVFSCLQGADLPRVSAVGRLDQASEGLLLFTNDTAWGAALTTPAAGVEKVYHVQVDRPADAALAAAFCSGAFDGDEKLCALRAAPLRSGEKNGWLELVLNEGRNRHIRRLAGALGLDVLRLVRVAIGPLPLGDLKKGAWRRLSAAEAEALRRAGGGTSRRGS